MTVQADTVLRPWVEGVIGAVPVVFGMPSDEDPERCVALQLLDLSPAPAQRSIRGQQLRLEARARYLVSAWSPDPLEAGDLLTRLLFAAQDRADLVVVDQPVPPELWIALQTRPRPAFFLVAQLHQDRSRPRAKPASGRMEIELVHTSSLDGVVFGPGDVPLSNALVELPGHRLSEKTDGAGRFRFAHVPTGNTPLTLRVRSRAGTVEQLAPRPGAAAPPLIIRIQPTE